MLREVLLSPPVAFCCFLALAYGIHQLSGRLAASSEEQPGKHQPYACGEDIVPPRAQLDYQPFFQLVLMFGILHLSALVISTLPPDGSSHRLATAYLVCIAISVLVLTGRKP
jgi:NADH:ubiquinone oxidoreductase subunit 3 (subunit A)